jgi:predicted KAP-like P-loop ATPase
MRVVLIRSALRPRLLAELVRSGKDDAATLALLVNFDVSNDEVLELLADDLTAAERATVAEALDHDRPDDAA